MPDHDLIAALAEGRLDPREAQDAERSIAADPEAAEVLAAHRRALSALGALQPATLTETERDQLRNSVAGAVGLDLTPEPVVRRRAPWAAISVAAATLAALVAVVPLAGLLTGSGDSTADTLGVAEVDDTARTQSGSIVGESDLESAPAQDSLDGAEVSTTAAATVSAPAGEEARVPDELSTWIATFAESPSSPDLEDAVFEATEETGCVSQAEELLDTGEGPLLVVELLYSDGQALIFFTTVEDMVATLAAFSPTDCSLLATIP